MDLELARQEEVENTEEGVEATDELSDYIEGKEVGDGRVAYVNRISVDTVTEKTFEIYEWSSAQDHHLDIADFTLEFEGPIEATWRRLRDGADDVEITVEPDWVFACDVRGLSIDGMNLLGLLAQIAGAKEDDLSAFRLRWELGLDPEVPVHQLALPFTPNSSDGRRVRQELARVAELRRSAGWAQLAALP